MAKLVVWVALGLLLAGLAVDVSFSVWRTQSLPSPSLARELDEQLRARALEEREQARARQERVEVLRVADRLRADLEAQEQGLGGH